MFNFKCNLFCTRLKQDRIRIFLRGQIRNKSFRIRNTELTRNPTIRKIPRFTWTVDEI